MYQRFFIIIIVVLNGSSLLAQAGWEFSAIKADSLRRAGQYEASISYYQKALNLIPNDSIEQISKYTIRLGLSQFMLGNDDQALEQYRKVLNISRIDSISIYRAHAYNNIGLIYDNKGKFEKSLENYLKASLVYKALDEGNLYGLTKMNMGIVLKKKGTYKRALTELLEAQKYFELNNDSLRMSEVYCAMGNIQENMGYALGAINLYKKTMLLLEAIDDDYGLSSVYNNLAGIYKSQGQLDSAITYFSMSLSLMSNSSKRNWGITLHNLADAHRQKGNIDVARSLFKQALAHKTILKDSSEMAFTANSISHLELEANNLSDAVYYLDLANACLKKNIPSDNLRQYYFLRSRYYRANNEIDSALLFLEYSYNVGSEISTLEYLKEVAVLQEGYDSQEKRRTIANLKQKNKYNNSLIDNLGERLGKSERNRWLIILFASVLITVIGTILLFVQQRLKYNKERVENIEQKAMIDKLEARITGIEEEKKSNKLLLHDAAGSKIHHIRMLLSGLMNEEKESTKRERLLMVQQKVEGLSAEIIPHSHNQELPDFDNITYSTFIDDWLFDWFEHDKVELKQNPNNLILLDKLDVKAKEHLYRSLQEALVNIKKHAKATLVELRISRMEDEVIIELNDNGVGISGVEKRRGIGLNNMSQRMILSNGSFNILGNENGRGTLVRFCLPVKNYS